MFGLHQETFVITGRRRALIQRRQSAREGKRFAAFYRGCRDYRAGKKVNPYAAGTTEAQGWQAGFEYAEEL